MAADFLKFMFAIDRLGSWLYGECCTVDIPFNLLQNIATPALVAAVVIIEVM